MRFLHSVFMLGGPGLVVGAAVGAAVRTWKMRFLLAVLGAMALLYGFGQVPSRPDDDEVGVLAAIVLVTNFGGWIIGLVIGGAVTQMLRSSAVSARSRA